MVDGVVSLHGALALGEVIAQFLAQVGQFSRAAMEGGAMAQVVVNHAEIVEHQIDRIELKLHGYVGMIKAAFDHEFRGCPTPPSPGDW
jgi:hypothetical protein